MAFKIIWSPTALEDLREISEFIAKDDPAAADRVGRRIIGTVELLAGNPNLGRVLPERPHLAYREIVQRPYRILYHVRKRTQSIEVMRIWHGARGVPRL